MCYLPYCRRKLYLAPFLDPHSAMLFSTQEQGLLGSDFSPGWKGKEGGAKGLSLEGSWGFK